MGAPSLGAPDNHQRGLLGPSRIPQGYREGVVGRLQTMQAPATVPALAVPLYRRSGLHHGASLPDGTCAVQGLSLRFLHLPDRDAKGLQFYNNVRTFSR